MALASRGRGWWLHYSPMLASLHLLVEGSPASSGPWFLSLQPRESQRLPALGKVMICSCIGNCSAVFWEFALSQFQGKESDWPDSQVNDGLCIVASEVGGRADVTKHGYQRARARAGRLWL